MGHTLFEWFCAISSLHAFSTRDFKHCTYRLDIPYENPQPPKKIHQFQIHRFPQLESLFHYLLQFENQVTGSIPQAINLDNIKSCFSINIPKTVHSSLNTRGQVEPILPY